MSLRGDVAQSYAPSQRSPGLLQLEEALKPDKERCPVLTLHREFARLRHVRRHPLLEVPIELVLIDLYNKVGQPLVEQLSPCDLEEPCGCQIRFQNHPSAV